MRGSPGSSLFPAPSYVSAGRVRLIGLTHTSPFTPPESWPDHQVHRKNPRVASRDRHQFVTAPKHPYAGSTRGSASLSKARIDSVLLADLPGPAEPDRL